jgi:hypothetical protein
MAFINDYYVDLALLGIQHDGDIVYICSREPTTYLEATTTYSLGSKSPISISAPLDRVSGGRRAILGAIENGDTILNGQATHYAIVNNSNNRLMVTGNLTSPQTVYAGNKFSTNSLDIIIPDSVNP